MFGNELAPYLSSILALAAVHTIAVVSPGPDFAMTMRNSLVYSRRTGLFGALGTTAGMCVHLSYTLLGLSYVVKSAPWVLEGVKYLGAAYLIYIGAQSFRKKGSLANQLNFSTDDLKQTDITAFQAFRTGFITNLLNPMVILFFVSALSFYMTETTPKAVQVIYGVIIVSITTIWFSMVALCFSQERIRQLFQRMGHWLERLTGGLLISFGIKLLVASLRT
jgi:RhtB (resistance to homoserine/threonine) family protein